MPTVENTQRLWKVSLEALTNQDPSIDKIEATLKKIGLEEVSISKTPLVVEHD